MSYQIKSNEERKELVTVMVKIFNVERKKLTKRTNNQLLNKLHRAHLHPDQIKQDMNIRENEMDGAIHHLITRYISFCTEWAEIETRNMNKTTTQSKKKGVAAAVKELISEDCHTWEHIESVMNKTMGIKKATLRQYRSDFRNPKYAPREGVMATKGNGTVCWI